MFTIFNEGANIWHFKTIFHKALKDGNKKDPVFPLFMLLRELLVPFFYRLVWRDPWLAIELDIKENKWRWVNKSLIKRRLEWAHIFFRDQHLEQYTLEKYVCYVMYYKKTMLFNFITELHQFNTGNGFNYSNAHFLISDHHLYNCFVTVYIYRWKCLCQLIFVFRLVVAIFITKISVLISIFPMGNGRSFWMCFTASILRIHLGDRASNYRARDLNDTVHL